MNNNEVKKLSIEEVKVIEKNAAEKIRLIEKTLFDTVKDCQSQLNQLRNDTAILISKIHAEVKEAKEKFNEGRECEHEWERKFDLVFPPNTIAYECGKCGKIDLLKL